MNRFALDRVSLTGVDDKTRISDLVSLGNAYPFVEWALLYVPHKEGVQRNPSAAWRQAFFDANVPGYSSVHLCGSLAFRQLLEGNLPVDIYRADRIQLNINARGPDFTEEQVMQVYRTSLTLGPDVILQCHSGTEHLIKEFISEISQDDLKRVHVLLDASKGKGVKPDQWDVPGWLAVSNAFFGFAGGLAPDNIADAIAVFEFMGIRYWPDMESGIRTNNEFDVVKAQAILSQAQLARIKSGPIRPRFIQDAKGLDINLDELEPVSTQKTARPLISLFRLSE